MTLTEQWKKGELEIDDKVMKHLTGEIKLTSSKDELIKYLEDKAWTLKEENQQLKELLYSLKCCLSSQNIEPQIRVEKSLAKIDNAIGEKK